MHALLSLDDVAMRAAHIAYHEWFNRIKKDDTAQVRVTTAGGHADAAVFVSPDGVHARGEFGHVQIGPERLTLVYDPTVVRPPPEPPVRVDPGSRVVRFGIGAGLADIGHALATFCWHDLRPKYRTERNLIEKDADGRWMCPCCTATFVEFCHDTSPMAAHLFTHGIASGDCCAASCVLAPPSTANSEERPAGKGDQ